MSNDPGDRVQRPSVFLADQKGRTTRPFRGSKALSLTESSPRRAPQPRKVQPAPDVRPVSDEARMGLKGSWAPKPLRVTGSGLVDVLPSVGSRDDGVPVLYPRKTHTLSSEPEAGKTWLALHLANQEMAKGRSVVYIDYEDDEQGISSRLRALGASPESIDTQFVYIRPEEALNAHNRAQLIGLVRSRDVALVVIDGVTEAMTTEGKSLLDNREVAEFFRGMATPLADAGPAVLLLDHEVKKSQDRGRYGLGAQHKLAAVSGAAFKLLSKDSFVVGGTGRSLLVVAKDRPGQVRRHSLSQVASCTFAELVLTSATDSGVQIVLSANPGAQVANDALREMKDKLVNAIGRSTSVLTTKGAVYQLVPGNAQKRSAALTQLLNEGVVSSEGGIYRLTTE